MSSKEWLWETQRPEELPCPATPLHVRIKGLLRALRQRIRNSLDCSEMKQVVERLMSEQYRDSLDILSVFNLYNLEKPQKGDIPPPTLEQAKEIFMKQVTSEQLGVIKGMKNPTLQLIPICPMSRYVKALDSRKSMSEQIDAHIPQWIKLAFERADERDGIDPSNNAVIGWRIAITEGEKEPQILQGDNTGLTYRRRIAWFKKTFDKKGVSGVDFKRVIVLIMKSLKNNEPISDIRNNGTWTLINEEPENNGDVAGACWDDETHQVNTNAYNAVNYDDFFVRFRTSVVVDVPRASGRL